MSSFWSFIQNSCEVITKRSQTNVTLALWIVSLALTAGLLHAHYAARLSHHETRLSHYKARLSAETRRCVRSCNLYRISSMPTPELRAMAKAWIIASMEVIDLNASTADFNAWYNNECLGKVGCKEAALSFDKLMLDDPNNLMGMSFGEFCAWFRKSDWDSCDLFQPD